MQIDSKYIEEQVNNLHYHYARRNTLIIPVFDLTEEFEHIFDKSSDDHGRVYVNVFYDWSPRMCVEARAYQGGRDILNMKRFYDSVDDPQESIKQVNRMIQCVRLSLSR